MEGLRLCVEYLVEYVEHTDGYCSDGEEENRSIVHTVMYDIPDTFEGDHVEGEIDLPWAELRKFSIKTGHREENCCGGSGYCGATGKEYQITTTRLVMYDVDCRCIMCAWC